MGEFLIHTTAELGGYREWASPRALSAWCDALWIYHAGATPQPHRLLPDRMPSLVLRFSRQTNGPLVPVSMAVAGGRVQAGWYTPEANDVCVAFRLKPELSAAAFGICPKELTDLTHDAPPKLAVELERLLNEGERADPRNIAIRLSEVLMRSAKRPEHRIETYAADQIRRSHGRVSVSQLSIDLDISERQLRRRFIDTMGVSPKTYARLCRHLFVVEQADANPNPDWAGLANDAGYSDQSHLIHEFRELTGLSPAKLHAERRAESDFSNTGY